jgi:GrpB-like predicted nucleotidyltransferase (UPF0157 family)
MSTLVVDYEPKWPEVFARLRATISEGLGPLAVAIEHVGSTSVPGLVAKPVIDMSVVVAFDADVPAAIDRLAKLGYRHRGNLGVEGREAFDNPPGLPAHNLYVCPEGNLGLLNHLAVRDYLRSHPDTATAYGELKKKLAARFASDIDAYIDGKTDFILGVLAETGFTDEELTLIAAVNRNA